MSNTRTENVIKNSTSSIIYKIVHVMIQFVMRTAFIRILGNEYTGVSGLFTDIVQVLSVVELGLDSSMVYALYKPLAQRDEKRISALLKFYRSAFDIIGIAVLLGGLCLLPFLHLFVNDVPNIKENINCIFMMYVITSGFSYFLIYKTVLLRADQKSRTISNCSSVVEIVECVLEIVLLLVFKNFYAYLILRFIATVSGNMILSIISTRKYPEYMKRISERLAKADQRRLLRDLACITIYNIASVVINSTDSVFISAFVGTAEVAVIGNFTLIIRSVNTTIGQVANATKASVGNLVATANIVKQHQTFGRMNFLSFWAACCSGTCLMALLNPFIGDIWFDRSYTVPDYIIAIMVLNFFIAIMAYPVESFRIANGLFVYGWYRPAVMAVLNIVLDIYMGRKWGITGIFLATSISRLLTQVWFDPYLIYKLVFRKDSKEYFLKYILYVGVTALSCLTAFEICKLVSLSNVLIGFGSKLIVAMVIPNIFICLLFRKTDEYSYVLNMVKSLLKKVKMVSR